MNNSMLWLIALVLIAVVALQSIRIIEIRRQHMTLAIQFDGLRDQQEHYNERNRKALEQLKRFEPGTFDHGAIEYSHPIYKIPESGK